jgi:hypothetical protein
MRVQTAKCLTCGLPIPADQHWCGECEARGKAVEQAWREQLRQTANPGAVPPVRLPALPPLPEGPLD